MLLVDEALDLLHFSGQIRARDVLRLQMKRLQRDSVLYHHPDNGH